MATMRLRLVVEGGWGALALCPFGGPGHWLVGGHGRTAAERWRVGLAGRLVCGGLQDQMLLGPGWVYGKGKGPWPPWRLRLAGGGGGGVWGWEKPTVMLPFEDGNAQPAMHHALHPRHTLAHSCEPALILCRMLSDVDSIWLCPSRRPPAGEHIAPSEFNFKLHPAAVPVKNVELSNDRVVAEADLRRRLGTLRWAARRPVVPGGPVGWILSLVRHAMLPVGAFPHTNTDANAKRRL